MARSRQGKFCGGQPPIGLMRDPDDSGHLIIDPETAPIIRRIFDLALDGMGNMRIYKVLMEEQIPITWIQQNTDCDVNYYAWSGSRISTISRNPFYKGAHVVCKTRHTGKGSVPILTTLFRGRREKSLRTAIKQLFPKRSGKRYSSL